MEHYQRKKKGIFPLHDIQFLLEDYFLTETQIVFLFHVLKVFYVIF